MLQAFASLMQALSLDPTHLPSLAALGALYQGRGLLQEAHAAFSRAHQLQPDEKVGRAGGGPGGLPGAGAAVAEW